MFCEKCGHKIQEGEVFCSNCGAKLTVQPKTEPEPPKAPPVQETPAQQPPVMETPAQQPPIMEAAAAMPTGDDRYRQIIGSNSDYYLQQFADIRAGGKGRINWASFFLTLYHAAYRGVWKDWVKAIIIPFAVMAVSSLLAGLLWGSQFLVALILLVVAAGAEIGWIVCSILFAVRFNRVYFEHVETKIAQNDFTPDCSGGHVVLSIIAYMAAMGILSGALSATWAGGLFIGLAQLAGDSSSWADEMPDTDDELEADTAPTVNVADYAGYWMVDKYNSTAENFVGVELVGDETALGLTANASWSGSKYITTIDKIALTLNDLNMEANGSYKDNHGNSGTVTVDFEDGEVYLTITAAGGDHGMAMTHEHCSKDPYGASREYKVAEQETTQAQTQTQTQTQVQAPPQNQPQQASRPVVVDDPSDTLYNYVYSLNDAINAGTFSYVAPTLLHGSNVYKEQQTLVSKLYKQGIKENVISVEVSSQKTSGNTATVVSKELIGVTYGDGSYKEIPQSYAYHMQLQSDGSWLIDSMTEQ